MPSGKWLTPNEEVDGVVCRPLFIPVDDQLYFLAAVNGALLELTHVWNWEDFGTMSAQDAADMMNEMYAAYATDTGCSTVICDFPPPYDIDIGFPIRIIRIGDDGHFEELIDGVWTTPEGDYEVPAVPEREEPTEEERRCLAAANAVAVLASLYETATDTFLSDGTEAGVYEAFLGAIASGLGAWAVGFAASGIGLAIAAFFAFYELLETVTDDLWTAGFSEQLQCIFYNCSNDASDVVTFDWECIREGLSELSFTFGTDLDKQLLVQQVLFILSIIGVDGLNHAGATTSVGSADCDECGDWCWLFDFATSNGGFAAAYGGFYDTSLTPDRWRAAQNVVGFPNRIGIRATRSFSSRFITRLEIDHELDKVIGGFGDNGTINLLSGGLLVWSSPSTVALCGGYSRRTEVFFPNVVADEIRFGTDVHTNGQPDGCSGANGQYYCYDILIAGEGSNPIGTDNC